MSLAITTLPKGPRRQLQGFRADHASCRAPPGQLMMRDISGVLRKEVSKPAAGIRNQRGTGNHFLIGYLYVDEIYPLLRLFLFFARSLDNPDTQPGRRE